MTDEKVWYVAIAGQQHGPFTLQTVVDKVRQGEIDHDAHVYTQGMADWEPIAQRDEFAGVFAPGYTGGKNSPDGPMTSSGPAHPQAAGAPVPVASAAAATGGAPSGGSHTGEGSEVQPISNRPGASGAASGGVHEIDYEVFGEEMQFVRITLDPQEACVAEAGAFMYMDPGISMETIFGDGSAQSEGGGLMGKLMSAGKRVLTGESLFMTVFANTGGQRQDVAFASPYPGKIIAVDLGDYDGKVLCQKDAFLVAAKGISVGIELQRRIGAGLFGGEGFILQKLEGDGLAFMHAGGTVVSRRLQAGETLRVDTGCLVAFESTVTYDITSVPGIKTAIFGGEGLFFAQLTGPGTVWIQSLPFSRLAGRIVAAIPRGGKNRQGEGSALGDLGELFMGK